MRRAPTHGAEPLSPFALIVVGVEMLAIVGLICYACTGAANAGHAATWFGAADTIASRAPKGR